MLSFTLKLCFERPKCAITEKNKNQSDYFVSRPILQYTLFW
jgi:hypothetical protein